jgi:SAM-dependent methyltransferase
LGKGTAPVLNASNEFDDVRCIACGADGVDPRPGDDGPALVCGSCGTSFDTVLDVPYFGQFEGDDLLGLIEIAANAGNRGRFGVTPAVVEDWERLLGAYHAAPDKAEFARTHAEARSPFLANRYGEWVEITELTRGVDLQGAKVLDVGAGLGFDSHRLSLRGAQVTALEFSPLLAEWGAANFPHIRWIGGFSHCLPFKSGSFDAVFCNAALHHMRDIPAAISEALRVLRPGGLLITTCDSFRSDASSGGAELRIFDREPSVLLGVNEGVPRFREFVATVQLHPELLEVELFTHTLIRRPLRRTLDKFTRWTLADRRMLARSKGSLAMRVRLKDAWPQAAPCQTGGVLAPGEYASWLGEESAAISRLAPLMPDRYFDLPFPGRRSSKFELLNGWRLRPWYRRARIAVRRGRWFLRRPSTAAALVFDLRLPVGAAASRSISVILDGAVRCECEVGPALWTPVVLDLGSMDGGQKFVVELRMQGGQDTMADASFLVRDRRFLS